MKWFLIILAGIFGVILLGVIIFVVGLASFRTDCVNAEEGIKAQYTQNQNSYDSMWKMFKEMAQVPDMKMEHLRKLYDGTMAGRYGDGGSKAVMQFIQEQNPTLGEEMYTKLQSAIEAGRRRFMADQNSLIAKKEAYSKLLRGNAALVYNLILGFPKINLDDFGIVTSVKTKNAFETGEDDEIQLH
ncbi:MAG: hypothetical protein ABIG71_03270 [Candidatus Uhrbacteria bacterium]